jgi:hypothetical protein
MFASQSPIFADLKQNVGNLIVNALAVAGAGAFGYFLTRSIIWAICKFGLQKNPPARISKLLGILGGVAMAILIAGLLFQGQGGGGWGFGPGFGFGTGTGVADGTNKTEPTASQTKPESTETSVPTPKTANPLRIRMLGGQNVKTEDGKLVIYQPLPGNEAYTLDRLKSIIRDRMQDQPNRPAIKEIVIIIEKDSVAHNHDAVLKLQQFALDQGLTVTIQRPPNS